MIDDQVLLSQLRQMDLSGGTTQTSQSVMGGTTQVSGGITAETTHAVSGTGAGVGFGGSGVVMNNYINGTGEQVARVIQDQIIGQLKVGRQFGAV